MERNTRIEWVDVYKGIIIILVVIGHSTGKFNSIIYQFHMAAFFFISGYVSRLEKKKFVETTVNKFFTLLLPYIVAVIIGIGINAIINYIGLFNELFNFKYVNVKQSFIEFIVKGNVLPQFLGATWFLTVLFGIYILQSFLISINNKKIDLLYLLLSLMIFILGYIMVKLSICPHISFLDMDLIFIAQFYFSIGVIFGTYSKEKNELKQHKIFYIIMFLLAVMIMMWGMSKGIVVDFPTRNFGGLFYDTVVAFAGVYVIIFISICVLHCKYIKKLLSFCGRNSLGILILHFAFFKIYFVILYELELIGIEDIGAVVLNDELGRRFWLGMVLFTIPACLITWTAVKKIKFINFLMGNTRDAYHKIANCVEKNKIIKKLETKAEALILKLFEFRSNVVLFIKEYKWQTLITIIGVFAICIPLYQQGIMCNDELQSRYWALQGFRPFYSHFVQEHIQKGRALSTYIVSFTMYLGFVGAKSNYIYKLVQILSIIVVAVLFGILLNKLFKNKRFAVMCSLVFVLFLPVTFEHTVPNAFVTLYNVPFCFLLMSFCFFCDYIKSKKGIKLVWSMVLFFIVQMSYEAFVTYVILYLMIALGLTGIKNWKRNLTLYVLPIVNSIVFLICYVISGKIFPSNYGGNQITFVSIRSSLCILKQLFLVSLPGYYTCSDKYKGLYNYYNIIGLYEYARVLIVICCIAPIFLFLIKKTNPLQVGTKTIVGKIYVILCGVMYIIMPCLPICVAQMYQGNVGENGFMALPVTFFTYMAAIFVLCYVCWNVLENMKGKLYIFFVIVLCFLGTKVQLMNGVFAREQNNNFNRLVNIENFLETDFMASINTGVFYAPDLYSTKNALAISDGYWNEYCVNLGYDMQFEKIMNDNIQGSVWLSEDGVFSFMKEEMLVVLSPKELQGFMAIKAGENLSVLVQCGDAIKDHNFFIYSFVRSGEKWLGVNSNDFEDMLIGNQLSSSKKIEGYYEDGWMASKSIFEIRTGSDGLLELEFFYPFENYKDETLNIMLYVDDKMIEKFAVDEQNKHITLSVAKNKIIELKIECDFIIENTNADSRELSIVLVNIEGK